MVLRSSRQPVQARSMATRAALLDAAIECLCDDGYAAATTPEIARRAGVSRGAQLHHFPTKAELMSAAVEHVLQRRIDEFGGMLSRIGALDRVDVTIDIVWEMFQGPAFVAWVELWIAARTDPALAAIVAETDRRFTDETRSMFLQVVPDTGAYDPYALELVRDFIFAVMNGVALSRLVPRGQRPASDYLDVLKSLAATMLTAARVAPEAR
jgi:AcrR family transcriptional regulator